MVSATKPYAVHSQAMALQELSDPFLLLANYYPLTCPQTVAHCPLDHSLNIIAIVSPYLATCEHLPPLG